MENKLNWIELNWLQMWKVGQIFFFQLIAILKFDFEKREQLN